MTFVNVTNSFKALQILLVLSLVTTYSQGHINMTEYKRMPVLHKFDNYDECVNRTLHVKEKTYPAKYCMIFVQIQPDNNSQLWQQINEFSYGYKFRYRHDQLLRGLCLENCKNSRKNSTTNVVRGLLRNKHTEIFSQVHKTPLDHLIREQYQSDIYECVNREFEKNYNLSTQTFIQYCVDPEIHQEKDIYFYITVLIIVILLFLCLFSTLYDAKLKSQHVNTASANKYYETTHSKKVHRYLTAFSLCRNYKRLVQVNKSDIGLDLSFLDGFRFILSFIIVMEHTALLQYFLIENSELIEIIYETVFLKLCLTAMISVELFFMLTGLLLYVKFDKAQYITPKSTFGDCINVYIRLLISRYLRFLPSLIFVLMFTANIMLYKELEPFSRFVTDHICWNCRDNWWQTTSMASNYFLERACVIPTWYISADFQLFALFLIVLIITAKYPKIKTYLFIAIAVLAAAINVLLIYGLKLAPLVTVEPEFLRFVFVKKIETSKYLYFSSYTHLNTFLVGIVCGFIYMKYLHRNPENKLKLANWLRLAPHFGWPIVFAILYLGTTIVHYKETTTMWTAMYCLLQRHVGLSLVAIIVILRGMCIKGEFLNFTLFRLLARTSFQEYLWNINTLIYLSSYIFNLTHIDFMSFALFSVVFIIASYMTGFVVALVVEYPFAEIINIFDIEKNIKTLKSS